MGSLCSCFKSENDEYEVNNTAATTNKDYTNREKLRELQAQAAEKRMRESETKGIKDLESVKRQQAKKELQEKLANQTGPANDNNLRDKNFNSKSDTNINFKKLKNKLKALPPVHFHDSLSSSPLMNKVKLSKSLTKFNIISKLKKVSSNHRKLDLTSVESSSITSQHHNENGLDLCSTNPLSFQISSENILSLNKKFDHIKENMCTVAMNKVGHFNTEMDILQEAGKKLAENAKDFQIITRKSRRTSKIIEFLTEHIVSIGFAIVSVLLVVFITLYLNCALNK